MLVIAMLSFVENAMFMKTNVRLILSSVILALLVFSCFRKPQTSKFSDEITVFAAAGLSDVVAEIRDSFELIYGVEVNLNVASSGTLARQIEQGISPDIFLSASAYWVHYLDSLDLLAHHQYTAVAQTSLVLVGAKDFRVDSFAIDSTTPLQAMLGDGLFSMGNPSHVPAGEYALQSLLYYDLFDDLKGNLLYAQSVRVALRNVELGEAKLALVYHTDALKSEKVNIISVVPKESYKAIEFMLCKINEGASAQLFYDFIQSDRCEPIWEKYGFE